MYTIARYLTDDEKRRACEAAYHPDTTGHCPRTNDRYCPLGMAFRTRTSICPRAPSRPDVTPLVTRAALENLNVTYRELADAFYRFIDDWDDGRIPNLREALGLEGDTDGS